jgi:hypothetical protein
MTQLSLYPHLKPQMSVDMNVALYGVSPTRIRNFLDWHKKNPIVWKEVERKFIEKAKDGQKRIGVKEIFEEIRQELTNKPNEGYKLNNNWTAAYARLLAYKYPELAGCIELRGTHA